jgi:hypothetical protein
VLGEFAAALPDLAGEHGPDRFLQRAIEELTELDRLRIADKPITELALVDESAGLMPLDIIDKHGLELQAFNLTLRVGLGGERFQLGHG